ncbi:hypothetical protein [Streptomyces sp. CA-132043]|uniref:hypothetical protein n=1 Tax=Streptomyces sp. CA-132043 TaxID=3240048 RepID=UPI003D921E4D
MPRTDPRGASKYNHRPAPGAGRSASSVVPPAASHPVAKRSVDDTWLSVGVLAVGADGRRALVSHGEIAPGCGNRGAILASSRTGHRRPDPGWS